jgi:hypothetical protein
MMLDRQWSAVPEETCVQKHFYSAERDDGTIDARLEIFLSEVEGRAAPVYEGLLEGRLPRSPQSRFDFAQFLALLHTRTTAMRRMFAEITGRMTQIHNYAYAANRKAFEGLMCRFEAVQGETIDSALKEKIRQAMLDPSGYIIEMSQERTFRALGASDKLTPILNEMKWSLAFAEHGYFITSDNPLVREVDPKTCRAFYGDHGFLNKTAEVSLPLSPGLVLLLSWDGNASTLGWLDRDNVRKANAARAAHSERYLFAHIKDKQLRNWLGNTKTHVPG